MKLPSMDFTFGKVGVKVPGWAVVAWSCVALAGYIVGAWADILIVSGGVCP